MGEEGPIASEDSCFLHPRGRERGALSGALLGATQDKGIVGGIPRP